MEISFVSSTDKKAPPELWKKYSRHQVYKKVELVFGLESVMEFDYEWMIDSLQNISFW